MVTDLQVGMMGKENDCSWLQICVYPVVIKKFQVHYSADCTTW